jgi:hypothetical protein
MQLGDLLQTNEADHRQFAQIDHPVNIDQLQDSATAYQEMHR